MARPRPILRQHSNAAIDLDERIEPPAASQGDRYRVGHGNPDMCRVGVARDSDRAALQRELHGIGEQVEEDLAQPVGSAMAASAGSSHSMLTRIPLLVAVADQVDDIAVASNTPTRDLEATRPARRVRSSGGSLIRPEVFAAEDSAEIFRLPLCHGASHTLDS
jgi:hypothetical protein